MYVCLLLLTRGRIYLLVRALTCEDFTAGLNNHNGPILLIGFFFYNQCPTVGMSKEKEGRKEGNVLFNEALNTLYLRLYGIRHMVKDHSDSERKPAAATWATLSD